MATRRLTDKKFNEVNNFLMKYVDPEAAKYFREYRKQGKEIEWIEKHWDLLEQFEPWTNTYSSVNDLTLAPEEQMQKIYNKNPDYSSISPARLKTILNNNDFTEEDLKKYYQFRADQKAAMDRFNKERYVKESKEYGEAARSKDDSYFNTPLANEYARKHYIMGHPVQARINEVAGKVAGATDFAPFPISLAGPLIRSAQKWSADEPVITAGTAADFGGSFIPDFAEKGGKLAWQYMKQGKLGKLADTKLGKQVEARINAADNAAKAKATADLDLITKTDLDKLTDTELYELYKSIDNPEYKAAIENYWKARGNITEARMFKEMPDEMASEVAKKEMPKAEQELANAERQADYLSQVRKPELELKADVAKEPLFVNGDFNAYYKDVPLNVITEFENRQVHPDKVADALYTAFKYSGRKAARSGIGGRFGQWDVFDPTPKDDMERQEDWVIKTYSNEWSPNVKPEGYDIDPLIKNAYDKWLQNTQEMSYPVWLKARGYK